MQSQAELAQAVPQDAAQRPLFTDPNLAPFVEYLSGCGNAEGWFMVESAAIWDSLLDFQAQRGWGGHLLEIGVYKGKSAALIAKRSAADEEVWLVDRFLRHADVQRTLSQVVDPNSTRLHYENEDSFQLRRHPQLADKFGQFRFVHIDGEHSSAAIQEDLATAHAFGSREVLVAVDDIFNFTYPQLTDSLFRYVREHPDQFSLILVGYNKAYLARPYFAREYLQYCRDALIPRMERIGLNPQLTKTSYAAEFSAFGIGPRPDDGSAYRGMDHDHARLEF